MQGISVGSPNQGQDQFAGAATRPENFANDRRLPRNVKRATWLTTCIGVVCVLIFGGACLWAGRVWGWNEWVWGALPTQDFEMVFRQNHFPDGAIVSAPPDPSYVCHDWTFFGGVHNARAEDVEEILDGFGYVAVYEPQVGDVIVYRDAAGTSIVHSGLVKAVGEKGFVLIESKWGDRGRYIHLPAVNGLSLNYGYYRSAAHIAQ